MTIKWDRTPFAAMMRPRGGPRLTVGMPLPVFTAVWWLQGVMVGTAVLGCTVAGWWWVESLAMEDEAARFEAATTRTQALTAQMTAQMAQEGLLRPAEQTVRIRREVIFLNHLAEQRTFSWVQLLDDLEATVPMAVAILSMKVQVRDSTVLLTGRAPDLQTLNRFVAALQQHHAFGKTTLVNHQVQDDGGSVPRRGSEGEERQAAGPIEFSLAAHYGLVGGRTEVR